MNSKYELNNEIIDKLKFDDRGLIPAVVIDNTSKKILTLAYMNRESLHITIEEGRTCFYSRSRKELWRKGETSGNVQYVRSIVADCDYDALAVYVEKTGPACHLGNDSCFEFPIAILDDSESANDTCELADGAKGTNAAKQIDEGDTFKIEDLYALLVDRKEKMPEGSYTSYLFEKGIDKILKKIGEESTEVVIAGKAGDKAESIYEIADLAYHVLVMMVEMGIEVDDVKAELESRHVIDKKVKQEKMV